MGGRVRQADWRDHLPDVDSVGRRRSGVPHRSRRGTARDDQGIDAGSHPESRAYSPMGTTCSRQSSYDRVHPALTISLLMWRKEMTVTVARLFMTLILLTPFSLAGCMGAGHESAFLYKNLTVAEGSAAAGDGHKILFKGSPLALSGNGIKVGDQLRSVRVTQTDLTLINIVDTAGKGKVRIISVVP